MRRGSGVGEAPCAPCQDKRGSRGQGACGGVRRASCLRCFEDMTACTDLHHLHDPPYTPPVAKLLVCLPVAHGGERRAWGHTTKMDHPHSCCTPSTGFLEH